MKKILMPVIAFWIIFGVGNAQVINDGSLHGETTLQTKKGSALNELVGTPYENENFQPGKVVMQGNEPVNVFLRYNALNDEMEIKTNPNEEDIYVIADKKNTEYSIGNYRFLHKNFQANGNWINGYVKEYFKGENLSLLKRMSTKITEPIKAQTGYQKDKPGEMIIEEKYFLSFNDGTTQEVKLKEKDFKKALPNTKIANNYFSDNKVKDLEGFIKMLEWYDKQE